MMAPFLERLYGQKPEELHLLVWSKQGFVSAWFRDVTDAGAYVAAHLEHDLYVGIGLASEDRGPRRRCEAKDVAGIVGLGADIDVADPAHQSGKRYPPTKTAALELLHGAQLQPTLIVDSGHGLQAWWLFDAPWVFSGPGERCRAAELAKSWERVLQALATEHGWALDSVGDLSRVLRVAGTWNHKTTPPVPVRLLQDEGPRYTGPDAFAPYLAAPWICPVQASARLTVVGELVLDPEAVAPPRKFERLCRGVQKFPATWERRRTDLADQSASAYDMSLAWYAAAQDWTDQEITDLLIAWRRLHGEPLKLRVDYFQQTITRARGAVAKARANQPPRRRRRKAG
jgi:hypothetical protein